MDKKIHKDQKEPNCHFWGGRSKSRVLGPKAGYCTHAPCTQHHQRGGQNTQATPPSWFLDTSLPWPQVRTSSARLSGQGSLLLVLAPSCCSKGPVKPCLNFSSSLLSTSVDLERPKTMVCNSWRSQGGSISQDPQSQDTHTHTRDKGKNLVGV